MVKQLHQLGLFYQLPAELATGPSSRLLQLLGPGDQPRWHHCCHMIRTRPVTFYVVYVLDRTSDGLKMGECDVITFVHTS